MKRKNNKKEDIYVNANNLIRRFDDMSRRGTLLVGPNVTQDDLFMQIVGTIVKEIFDSKEIEKSKKDLDTSNIQNNEELYDNDKYSDIPDELKLNIKYYSERVMEYLTVFYPAVYDGRLNILIDYSNFNYKDDITEFVLKILDFISSVFNISISKDDVINCDKTSYINSIDSQIDKNSKVMFIHDINKILYAMPKPISIDIIEKLKSYLCGDENSKRHNFDTVINGFDFSLNISIVTCKDISILREYDLINLFNIIYKC